MDVDKIARTLAREEPPDSFVSVRWALLVACLAGCSPFTEWGHQAAAGAVDEITSADTTKRISALAAEAAKSASDSARESLLAEATDLAVARIVASAGAATDAQVTLLGAHVRTMLRASIDEALGGKTKAGVAALREQLAGAPLRADVDALIDAAAPHLAQAVQQAVAGALVAVQADLAKAKAEGDSEAAKWRPIAIAFAIGAGFLLVGLVLAVFLIRGHQRTIAALVGARPPPNPLGTP